MTVPTTNIVDLQRDDHATLDVLLRQYESGASDPDSKAEVYAEIRELVTTHAFAEETVLFPAARDLLGADGESVTADIEGKHQRINELMAQLGRMTPGSADFDRLTPELFELLRADVREEEDVLLHRLAASADDARLAASGAAWSVARRTAPNRPHPAIPRRPPGNLIAGIPLAVTDRVRHLLGRGGP